MTYTKNLQPRRKKLMQQTVVQQVLTEDEALRIEERRKVEISLNRKFSRNNPIKFPERHSRTLPKNRKQASEA